MSHFLHSCRPMHKLWTSTVSYDDYHEFKLSIETVLGNNRHITSDNFLDVEEPDLVDDDPETPLPSHQ